MKLAFCIFKYYAHGGMGRNFMRIIQACLAHGHSIDVYAMECNCASLNNLSITIIPSHGFTNHARAQSYVNQVRALLKQKDYDAIVGFNRMPGLDVFYAADVCYKEDVLKRHGWLYRLTNRYRTYARLEESVFNKHAKTHILLISENEKQHFVKHYQTQNERFHLLPPGINKDRIAPINATDIRHKVRQQHHLSNDQSLILLIGTNFHLKGVDRALRAIAALPQAVQQKTAFWVIGKGKQKPFINLAKKLHLESQIVFLGINENITQYLLAADLLIHPARREAAGMVILEAMVAGLPVLTTDVCGFAFHVKQAKAGLVVPSPFQQEQLNQMLYQMLTSNQRKAWKENGLKYAYTEDLYSRAETACKIIENIATTTVS
ncbi:MAG: glycosyltransferase family 4 protein [Pseudomonadota bacterium]